MSRIDRKDSTEFFTVVGAAYVPEHHVDGRSRYFDGSKSKPRETGTTASWLVLVALIVGISAIAVEASIFTQASATQWIDVPAVMMN